MSLTFEEFQEKCKPVKESPDEPAFWATGLGGEVGEVLEVAIGLLMLAAKAGAVLNVVKKLERDGASAELDKQLLTESGDLLFYLTPVLADRGFTIQDAAQACLDKLEMLRAEQS